MGGDKETLQDAMTVQCDAEGLLDDSAGQSSYDPFGLLPMADLFGNDFMKCQVDSSDTTDLQDDGTGSSSISPVVKGVQQSVQQTGKNLKVDLPLGAHGSNRVLVTDKTMGRFDTKTGMPRGEPIFRIDGPHGGAPYDHINVGKNVPKWLEWAKKYDHLKIPKIPDWILKGVKGAEKLLAPLAIGLDGYDLYSSYQADKGAGNKNYDETKKATGRVAGGWGGALGGAALGMAVGGPIGALICGVGGGLLGSDLGEWIGDLF